MAENSPLKQSRAFHPYGRVKSSPLKPSQHAALPITSSNCVSTATKFGGSYFSFSDGSSSLFPQTHGLTTNLRAGKTDVGNTINSQNPFSISNAKDLQLPETKPIIVASENDKRNDDSNPPNVEPIGSRRPKAPATGGLRVTGTGFIPIHRSFTIWSDAESNTTSMELIQENVEPKLQSLSITKESAKETQVENNENEKQESLVNAGALQHSKTVRRNLFLQGVEEESCLNKTATSGILTERKYVPYDRPEYVEDTYKYWINYERRVVMKPNYMSKQRDISHHMRSILVDWMSEVGQEYEFGETTVFAAVGFVDRFLTRMGVDRTKLQLVGTTALYIAAKIFETDPPGITDAVHITDETYPKTQILIMEGIILHALQYDLLVPTTGDFLTTLCTILSLGSPVTSLALYLSELTMCDGERYLRYKPSLIAAAAVALARYTHNKIFWDSQLELHSQQTFNEVRKVAGDLLNSFYDAPTGELTAVYEKYKSIRYNCVSLSILPAVLPENSPSYLQHS